ncbi:aldo/keto reductase [Enterococcus sp. BWT-B8]|uniref:aldo/keto reductase family protein n=1 Tax=Enterococcus sp. BWT-B8 TaxID=2885157 RepID=UPI001E3A7248|nr:aldo/keto reductase [Enterococcus sp. BWT-B8]MCB5951083.1 aldo/keto reductase [Enterococcus sp. BWT-B8]
METIRLNTGIELPIIGSGTNTFGKENRDYMGKINGDTTEIETAITAGYRHFDTAISYRNESVVASGIAKSGIPRSKFFITSKLPGKPEYTSNEAAVQKGVEESLRTLKTDYIDLFLIHHPWNNLEEITLVWKVLEKYTDKGVLKAIGVSNFNEEQLKHLLDHSRIKPAVNQIESHPGLWNDDIIAYSLENNIVPEAWGPLTRVSPEAKKILTSIGEEYGKTWAQIILRYQLDRGVVVIPKSHNEERQKQNLDLFDFELTEEQKNKIAQL